MINDVMSVLYNMHKIIYFYFTDIWLTIQMDFGLNSNSTLS